LEPIKRIVKMNFKPEMIAQFLVIFEESKDLIRSFEGCQHVELLKQAGQAHIMCTLSIWDSEAHLEVYRKSELFKTTWARTKVLFQDKAEAWTLYKIA